MECFQTGAIVANRFGFVGSNPHKQEGKRNDSAKTGSAGTLMG
jgi:hypothetical protein